MHLPLVKEYEEDINVTLERLQHSHLNDVIFSYLNMNYIIQISITLYIWGLKETTLDESFPIISSYVSIFSPYILHITDNKGGLMVFV